MSSRTYPAPSADGLSIAEIKGYLGDAGVTLPQQKQNRPFYVQLYNTHVLNRPAPGSSDPAYLASASLAGDDSQKDADGDVTMSQPASQPAAAGQTTGRGAKRSRTENGQESASEDESDAAGGYDADQSQTTQTDKQKQKKRKTGGDSASSSPAQASQSSPAAVSVSATTAAATVTASPRAPVTPNKPVSSSPVATASPAAAAAAAATQLPSAPVTPIVPRSAAALVTPALSGVNGSALVRRSVGGRGSVAGSASIPTYVDDVLLRSGAASPFPPGSQLVPPSAAQLNVQKPEPVGSFCLKLLFLVVLSAVAFVVAFAVYNHNVQDERTPLGKRYCDFGPGAILMPNTQEDCQECPQNAACAGGRIQSCAPGFVIRSAVCVKDERIDQEAISFIDILQKDLSIHAGEYICNGDKEQIGKPLEEIKLMLADKSNIKDPQNFEVSFQRMRELITEKGKQLELKEGIAPFVVTSRTQDANGTLLEVRDVTKNLTMIYSTKPKKSFVCTLRFKAMENIPVLCGAVLLLLMLLVLRFIRTRREAHRATVRKVINDVYDHLRQNRNNPWSIVHLKHHLREKYDKESLTINVETIWPEVENAIDNDSRVQKGPSRDGNGAMVYEWIAPDEFVPISAVQEIQETAAETFASPVVPRVQSPRAPYSNLLPTPPQS